MEVGRAKTRWERFKERFKARCRSVARAAGRRLLQLFCCCLCSSGRHEVTFEEQQENEEIVDFSSLDATDLADHPVVLLISGRYGTSSGDVSNINRQVAVLARKNGAIVYSTAFQTTEEEKHEASRDGVNLILPESKDPFMLWLQSPKLPKTVDCIVGHIDKSTTAQAARNIKENRYKQAKLIFINHDNLEDTEDFKRGNEAKEAYEKDRTLVRMAENADAVFSVGSQVFNSCKRKYRSLGNKKPRAHYLFLPRPSAIFAETHLEVTPVEGQKVVISIGRVVNLEKQKGYDIAARSIGLVAEKIRNVRFYVHGISKDEWEKTKEILERYLQSSKVRPNLRPCGTQSDIRDDLMTSHLFIMPSRCEPFGLDGLNAIAAGIPVLISDESGLADLIMELITKKKCQPDRRHRIVETSVRESDLETDAKRWAEKILDTLNNIEHEFAKAAEFKKELLDSKYWEESHGALLEACGITPTSMP